MRAPQRAVRARGIAFSTCMLRTQLSACDRAMQMRGGARVRPIGHAARGSPSDEVQSTVSPNS